jgi:SAM-dependent methyltransferase
LGTVSYHDHHLESLPLDLTVELHHRIASIAQAETVGGSAEDGVHRFKQFRDEGTAGHRMDEYRTVEDDVGRQQASESLGRRVRAAYVLEGMTFHANPPGAIEKTRYNRAEVRRASQVREAGLGSGAGAASPDPPRRTRESPRTRSSSVIAPPELGKKMEHMSDREMGRVDYDAELRLYNDALWRAYEIGPEDQVLDIGCGAGQTTRDAARLASDGWALGIDISKEMIERAHLLAEAEGLHNITLEHADAQDHRFPPERFDLAISRFGTMFFRDPVGAFTNIGRGLRRAGRLLMMVWQAHEQNEWFVSIERVLAATVGSPVPAPEGLDPFSLADPATARRVLDTAGFTDVTFTGVRQPICFGQDVAAALEWLGGFASAKEVLDRLDPTGRELALDRLRETLVAHAREDGVWFDSRAWIVKARRP